MRGGPVLVARGSPAIREVTGTHKTTILNLLVDVGEHCQETARPRAALACPAESSRPTKSGRSSRRSSTHLSGLDSTNPEIGEQYLFVALDPRSKLVAAHVVGKREPGTARIFLEQLRIRLGTPEFQFFTDGWIDYPPAIRAVLDDQCDSRAGHRAEAGPGRGSTVRRGG